MHRLTRRAVIIGMLATCGWSGRLAAQWQAGAGPAGAALGAVVGGDVERYLRALELTGTVRQLPWTMRVLGADAVARALRDSVTVAHPWNAALLRTTARRTAAGAQVFVSENSAFPWGANDGALWQGRGVTGALGLAMTYRAGPLSVVAAPVAFAAQNAAYPLMKPVVPGVSPLLDPMNPQSVDLPQRMGTSTYTRVDPGESAVLLSAFGVVAGISTASIGWGVGETFPGILGSNAGGFPHLVVGTRGRGVYLRDLGRFSGQYILGTLPQSRFSPVAGSRTFVDRTQSGTERIAVGVAASFLPEFLPGLELGVQRFYHAPSRPGAARWNAWSKPFEALYKAKFADRNSGAGEAGGDADNQLAALSVRWIFPARGVEASFEYLREDHSWDGRDFALEPENNSAVMASIRAVTRRTANQLAVLTLEYFNGDVSPIAQARTQAFLYANSLMRQGHTARGQLLGAPIGAGAVAAQRVAWERFTAGGSRRITLQRWRTRGLPTDDPEGLYRAPGQPAPDNHDYIIDGSVAESRLHGAQSVTLEAGIAWAGTWQFGDPRTNLYLRGSWSLF